MAASETRLDCRHEDQICWSPRLCRSIGRCQKRKPNASLTEHEIIVAQLAQKRLLMEPLELVAALSDECIDALDLVDARHTLKTYAALAKDALVSVGSPLPKAPGETS